MDAEQAFTGLAGNYNTFRPDYPRQALDTVREYVGSPGPKLLLDVGAGTGISTRALAGVFGAGFDAVGVEPGRSMLEEANADVAGVRFVEGKAEQLEFADSSAALVLAAQAVQWFDRPAFYTEAVRVLAPGCTLAIIQNDRDFTRSAFLDAYETFMETNGDKYSRFYRSFDVAGELNALDGVGEPRDEEFGWTRELDGEGFIGMAFSSTKMNAVVHNIGRDETRAALEELIAAHFPDGRVEVPYTTRLFLRRKGSP